MKRIVAICLSLVIALCGFSLAACGNDESVIRNGMSEELNMLKNMDGETADELVATVPYNMQFQAESMGLDLKEYLKAYFSGFDYQIGKIDINGDQATVEVTLNVKSGTDVSAAVQAYTNSLTAAQLQEVGSGAYSGNIPAWFGEGIVDAVRDVPNTETEVLEVPVTKTGNTWSFDEAADDILEAAVAGQ